MKNLILTTAALAFTAGLAFAGDTVRLGTEGAYPPWNFLNDAGEVEQWQAELTAPNKLARGGWTKNTLQPGYEIKIAGRVAKNGGKSVAINEIIMPDGQRIPLREVLD